MNELLVRHNYQILSNGQKLHFLSCGEAGKPAAVLLHPSPLSSGFMLPVMETLADRAHVIAIDTPGYGLSDPLTDDSPGLAPYVAALADFLKQANIQAPVIYGSSTGAQIALEYGKAHPKGAAGLILDNAAHFEDSERLRIVERYFPDRVPTADGAHLTGHWLSIRNLAAFFPWFEERESARLNTDLPPIEIIQAQLLDQLRAGRGYSRAYRAAFENEKLANLLPLRVNTCLVRWQASMLWPWMQAMTEAADQSDYIQLLDAAPELSERKKTIQTAYDHLADTSALYTPATLDFPERLKQAGAAWSDETEGALHWCGRAEQLSCVLLHDLGAGANCFAPLMKGQGAVLAVDLPGHGASEGIVDLTLAARQIRDHLQALQVARIQLVGIGLGAAIGAKLAALMPCDCFVAIDATLPAPLPDMTLRWGGSHLLEVWYALKDRLLYDPWCERTLSHRLDNICEPDSDELQDELLSMLIARKKAADWHEQLSAFDWQAAWATIKDKTTVYPAHHRTRPKAQAKILPAGIKDWAAPLAQHLTIMG